MTGRDPLPQGLAYTQISPWQNLGVPLNEHFISQSFKAAGYQTGMIGKWHLGHSIRQYLPNARGFDYFYGHVNTAIDFYTHQRRGGHDWQRNGVSVDEKGQYVTDLEGNDAVRFIRDRNKGKPFFLYIPFTAPHSPMQAPEEVVKKYHPKANGFSKILLMEFLLFGLSEYSLLSRTKIEDGLQFRDMISSMFTMQQDDDFEDEDDSPFYKT